jgi:glycerol-3-phosphate acyltransferase PlsY
LLGSIPFGYLIVRAKEGADVRESGSGGTGATNVSRRAGKLAGVVTLLLDAAKGALAVWMARWLSTPDWGINWLVAAAAIIAVLGHCFPVWLGFRGGKGVATGVGVFLSLSPQALALSALVFLLVFATTRYVSLGSITAATAFPLCVWLLSIYTHSSENLRPVITAALASAALMRGTESKFR